MKQKSMLKGEYYTNALQAAITRAPEAVIRLLLENGHAKELVPEWRVRRTFGVQNTHEDV